MWVYSYDSLTFYAIAYFMGSIPFGYIFTKLLTGKDVRTLGSGSVGATNALRSGSKIAALATLIADTAKAYAALRLLKWLGASVDQRAMAMMFIAAGHCWPLWLGFKGGKGIGIFLGILLYRDHAPYIMTLAGIIPGIAIIVATRMSSLGTLTGISLSFIYGLYANQLSLFHTGIVYLIILWQHRENIYRLLTGKERRI